MIDQQAIGDFLHGQVACWNAGDKEGFFDLYRKMAPNGLSIEYVGFAQGEGWAMLEAMWEQQRAGIRIEAIEVVIKGAEAACYHRNFRGTEPTSRTIELYTFGAGTLSARYFIAT
jgi:hypothetical protein